MSNFCLGKEGQQPICFRHAKSTNCIKIRRHYCMSLDIYTETLIITSIFIKHDHIYCHAHSHLLSSRQNPVHINPHSHSTNYRTQCDAYQIGNSVETYTYTAIGGTFVNYCSRHGLLAVGKACSCW